MFLSRVLKCNIFKSGKFFKYVENNAAKFSSVKFKLEDKISVSGQTINYVKLGRGKHHVLCFPGALGSIWSDFKPQLDNLDKAQFTLVAFDPPGYGFSRPPERVFGKDFYERDADSAIAFMHEIGIFRYSVLGWSDGGISALIMAAKYPETIEKLVIWGANSYLLSSEIAVYEKLRNLSQWSAQMKAPLIAMYGEDGLYRMWNNWCDTIWNIYKEDDGNICKEILPNIRCPTFILHGDMDPIVSNEHPKYLVNNIGPSKVHHFPKGKHNIHLRYAEEFNKLVTEFLTTPHIGK